MTDKFSKVTPIFDLPDTVHQQLVSDIQNCAFRGNFSYFNPNSLKNQSKLIRLLLRFMFGDVTFQTYQLSKSSEEMVYNHYKEFINFVGHPYKIRFKTLSNAKAMPPHSDVENSHRGTEHPAGDYCSVFIGISTNNETTNWYDYNGTFRLDNVNPFKLKKRKSICLQNKQACLFDNDAIHSVTGCNPKKTRWALAISWQNITYEELLQKYYDYCDRTSCKKDTTTAI